MFIFILECSVTQQCWSIAPCQSTEHLHHVVRFRPTVRQVLPETLERVTEVQIEVVSQKGQSNIPKLCDASSDLTAEMLSGPPFHNRLVPFLN